MNDQQFPIAAKPIGIGDSPAPDRRDRFGRFCPDVDSLVPHIRIAVPIKTLSKLSEKRPFHRPGQLAFLRSERSLGKTDAPALRCYLFVPFPDPLC